MGFFRQYVPRNMHTVCVLGFCSLESSLPIFPGLMSLCQWSHPDRIWVNRAHGYFVNNTTTSKQNTTSHVKTLLGMWFQSISITQPLTLFWLLIIVAPKFHFVSRPELGRSSLYLRMHNRCLSIGRHSAIRSLPLVIFNALLNSFRGVDNYENSFVH